MKLLNAGVSGRDLFCNISASTLMAMKQSLSMLHFGSIRPENVEAGSNPSK
jgi:hypothetical protein